ncbi:MAG: Asp-tRNA(Asn)/Glu-tRNA(Gln) amidotransferase subunit GatC [Holophagales bacterium]|nr:Asp-tRNA(Asn)/Glu-tRNA(Gln) amidotransferase subunit GatC [Holophagales bacterium]
MQILTREDVIHCAKLAALDLGEEEIEPLRKDMEQLLTFAKHLDEVDLGDAEPSMHLQEPELRRREDQAAQGLALGETLANAPENDGGYFVVPKIL